MFLIKEGCITRLVVDCERSSVNTQTGSENNNIIKPSMEKGGCVNKQTDSEGNILILSSISSSEDQRRAEDILESEDGLPTQQVQPIWP
jgi:hypothetical protein